MTIKYDIAVLACALVLTACTQKASAPVTEPSPFRPAATIQDIMQSVVDPAADFIWEAVSTTVTASGTEEKQPRTDEEWTTVRHQAITLVEATNLLVVPGRLVVHTGKALEDAHVPGINKAEDIQKLIDQNRAVFVAYAHGLQEASAAALAAIDQRDAAALIDAGGKIDHACEQCHLHYWYPNSPQPK
jgi:hypothetical protein